MIAVGDGMGVESRASGGLLPTFCVERRPTSSTPSSYSSGLSPAATVCAEADDTGDDPPEFKLSQCFGDCSPAEEVTQGNRPCGHDHALTVQ